MSNNIFEQRRENLKRLLTEKGIPALLVSHAANRYYLSGFELHDAQCNESTGWLVVTANGDDLLFTDPRYSDAALQVWDEDKLFIYSANKHALVSETLKKKGIKTLGIEPKALHLFDYDRLNDKFSPHVHG